MSFWVGLSNSGHEADAVCWKDEGRESMVEGLWSRACGLWSVACGSRGSWSWVSGILYGLGWVVGGG